MAISLKNKLKPYFPQRIRQRGDAYFWQGRVELEKVTGRSVKAVVRGSRSYEVTLELSNDKLAMNCDCPYRADSIDYCKHIWAVVLACSEQGIWREAPSFRLADSYYGDEDEGKEPGRAGSRWELANPGPDSFSRRAGKAKAPHWKDLFRGTNAPGSAVYHLKGEEALFYVVGPHQGGFSVQLCQSRRKRDGQWSALKPLRLRDDGLPPCAAPEDQPVLELLRGFKPVNNYGYAGYYETQGSSQYRLSGAAARQVLPLACATGRCFPDETLIQADPPGPLQWDGGGPWRLQLYLAPGERKGEFRLSGELRREQERLALGKIRLLKGAGLVWVGGRLLSLEDEKHGPWIERLGPWDFLTIPQSELDDFLNRFFQSESAPALDLPKNLEPKRLTPAPKARLLLSADKEQRLNARLRGELSFDYQGLRVAAGQPGSHLYHAAGKALVQRDAAAERRCLERLVELGFRSRTEGWSEIRHYWEIHAAKLPALVTALVPEGWHVEAQGRLYRSGATLSAQLKSGADWFNLELAARFDGVAAPVTQLLEALRKGQKTVLLDDGTYGILPEEWLARYGLVSRLGKAGKDGLGFDGSQLGLLDALLVAQPEVSCDEAFRRAREKLRRFEGIRPLDPPRGFQGVLRPYQREGLGWLGFLRDFGFGGCLADDMGLGKTVQVLALLENRRKAGQGGGAKGTAGGYSLVVVPKSLVFNWKQEAAKFTPQLRVMDHTGPQRAESAERFKGFDLVVTTYGTLRRDIAWLSQVPFDYAILDEAHAVKNPKAESAKAVRLLRARHRLALTGTPVQNSLDELWSLFEFLNPGMLGSSQALELASSGLGDGDESGRTLLARALRPFLLRRTKETVAKDLPSKTEQVLYCDMDAGQRSLYEGLRRHYLDSVMKKVEKQGLNRSKMHVLEALLRLRQAACHPGLIDTAKTQDLGGKLEMLIPHLREVLSEGHKALVFSQFTSFLSILRRHLRPLGIRYAYLDGQSRDREEQVKRFQEDPDCGLFLVSLKAGGLGLNLTAAEYVYLLDPWWNPAVEAQAVDRAHRIGQARHVFAYRLICRGTVEEKILEMQAKKKELARAVLGEGGGVLKGLTREELEWLLS